MDGSTWNNEGGSMGVAAEKVEIREVIGSAMNATNLGIDVTEKSLRDVDLIAAFGLAACGTLKRRLSEVLWRIRWGRDPRARREAGKLFSAALLHSSFVRRKWNIRKPSALLDRMALSAVIEWEHDKCPQCGGAGSVPRSKGRDLRVHCGVCRGMGRRRASHTDRALMLGVSMNIYEKHWQRHYDQALALLDQIEAEIVVPLQKKLRRA
jgi:hypothetical protein